MTEYHKFLNQKYLDEQFEPYGIRIHTYPVAYQVGQKIHIDNHDYLLIQLIEYGTHCELWEVLDETATHHLVWL